MTILLFFLRTKVMKTTISVKNFSKSYRLPCCNDSKYERTSTGTCTFGSSRPEVFCKKSVLRNFASHRKIPLPESLF